MTWPHPHPTRLFSYTQGVNTAVNNHGLYWLLDFIAAQQKRLVKDKRFLKGQRWVHRVHLRRATVYVYPIDSDDDPRSFANTLYSDVTEPEITFYLEEGVLCVESERPT